jgi:parallel beta-helix repeat protein
MPALSVSVPFPVFQDRDGQPLDNGYIYIGVANLDAQTNPVQVYFDEALTIPAAQPLRTINGYVSNAGTPAQLYVNAVNFSIKLLDAKGTFVYSFTDGTINIDAASVSYVPAGVGAVSTTVQSKLRQIVSVKDFDAVGDGVTDDTVAIQAAITASANNTLFFPAGTYLFSSTINLVSNITIDFGLATLKVKAVDYAFKGTSISNVTMIGGVWLPDASIVTGVHPTGTYGASCVAYFIGCTNCHVTRIVSASNFYGVLNFYNSSDCTATFNYLTDNAGGIQALADSGLTGSSTMRGIDFSHNIIEHSGDDGLSFLISATNNGNISASKIAFNHVTKDIGAKGTIGQARGIALVGGVTTGSNNIYCVEIIGNTGYYMGGEFIRATGVIKSTIANNAVNGFAANNTFYAYTLGSTSSGAYGVQDVSFISNTATNNLANVTAIFTDGAVRCKISSNYAVTTVAGQGALYMTNSDNCQIRDNTFWNSSAFGIQLASTTSYCDCYSNDVRTAVAGISDVGTNNYRENNRGWITRNVGQTAIGPAATSVTVSHGINTLTSGRLRVRLTPISPLYAAGQFYANGYSTTQFVVNLNVVPGGANTVFFEWEVYESRA